MPPAASFFAKKLGKKLKALGYENDISAKTVVSTKGGARSAGATNALCSS